MAQRRLGYFGGTFDPVHCGHVALAQYALGSCELDKLTLLPAATSPHKIRSDAADGNHRLAMLELAFNDAPNCEVCDWELQQKDISYTATTVAWVKATYPNDTLFWFIGSDQLAVFQTWHRAQWLMEQVQFLVFKRDHAEPVYPQGLPTERFHILTNPRFDISATDIRKRVREGASLTGLVPEAVANYLAKHQLYQHPC